jgi:NADPH:quinone reductase-like Zn-dependent oxidoreductase
MRTLTYAEYGGPDLLTFSDVPVPDPAAGQVVVKVHAFALNPFDLTLLSGAMAGGKPLGAPKRIGRDVAGLVHAVGDGVEGFAVGDRVAGNVNGGVSAEYVAVAAASLAQLPGTVGWEQGAAAPLVGMTALRVLGLSGIRPSGTLLVHAAAGGVGSAVTQLAVGRGITVIGTAGPANQEYLESIGATPVVYGDGWPDRVRAVTDRVDAVIDCSGAGVVEDSKALVAPGGLIVTIADFGATGENVVVSSGGDPEGALAQILQDVAAGVVTTQVQVFPFEAAADGYRQLAAGHTRGKLVVTVP